MPSKPLLQRKSFKVQIERRHWEKARRHCRLDGELVFGTRPVKGQEATADAWVNNCVIADALIESLGDEAPLKTRTQFPDDKRILVIDVGVGGDDAHIGGKRWTHDGGHIVQAFDDGRRPSKAGIVFPVTVTFRSPY